MFRVVCLLLALAGGSAQAQELLPYLSRPVVLPNPALPTQELTLRVFSNACGVFEIGVAPNVEVEGRNVSAALWVVEPCATSSNRFYMDFPLGRFAAGEYTLEYRPFSSASGNLPVEFAGFSVIDAVHIPSTSILLLTLAGTLVLAFGVVHLTTYSS